MNLGSAVSLALLITTAPPPTAREAVTDTYHGTRVTDDYHWLEDWEAEEVKQWTEAQNRYARGVLDELPNLDAIRQRVSEIMSAETVSYGGLKYRGGKLFVMKRQPPKQQPFLVVIADILSMSEEQILLDPNALSAEGSTSIDWFVPSPDGKLVAVSLSTGGSEAGDLHVYDTSTGRQVHEVIPRVNTGTAGGDLAWLPDGSGFFYTRHPRAGERPPEDMNFYQQGYFHQLGTPTEQDRYEIGQDFPRIAEIEFEMNDDNGWLLLTVQNGDGGEFAHYVRFPEGSWIQVSEFSDKTVQAIFGPEQDLYLISREDAPRGKIDHMELREGEIGQRKTIVTESEDTVVTSFYGSPPSLLPTKSRLFVTYQLGGPSEIRVFDHQGNRLPGPEQLPVSAVGGLELMEGDDVFFSNGSYTQPFAYYLYRPEENETTRTPFASTSLVDMSDVTVVREFATSKDGTRVPVNILLPPGVKRDGSNPTLVNGYGGYGISLTPRYQPVIKVLLEQGVIFAVANLRGGGEYGEQWHQEGNLTNKQNVFDDFAAALRHMIDRGYTKSDKLAIEGGSNGGLLMGALLTQHPGLVKCVVSHVGIYDMLRVELSPNGSFNIPEFGTVKNPEHFQAMHAYSPYHRVRDGQDYPPTLFLTGVNDPRVDPMQSRKMTARLQSATGPDGLILLRTSYDSGHGRGTPLLERIAQEVDVTAFLFQQLGVEM